MQKKTDPLEIFSNAMLITVMFLITVLFLVNVFPEIREIIQ
jgi:hypothetical protein